MAEPNKNLRDQLNKASAPKTIDLMGHSVHMVEADNPRSLALLNKAYKEVYEPAFPMPEERESLDAWLKTLSGANPTVSIVIAIVGNDIYTENPTIKGISVGYYYNKEQVGLLAYNAISPAARNGGLGRVMVEARRLAFSNLAKSRGETLKGVFLECNDPAKVKPEEDSFDPATRIKIFQKWGAVIMPIDYVQPALVKGGDKADKLKLLAYPSLETGEYPTPDGIKGFVTGIYTELSKYTGNIPSEDPDYIRITQQINALKPVNDNTPKFQPPKI